MLMVDFFQSSSDALKGSFEKLTKLNFGENFKAIFESPSSILILVALLILVVAFLKFKKINFTTRLMAQVSLMLALAIVLDFFKIYKLPQGGSVTLGSMVPIILISLWYGPEIGMLTGLLFGLLSLILGPYILHPVQVLFDYPLPFLALGVAGYFRKNKYIATVIAVSLRYACHVISGVVFFADYAPEGQSPLAYSLSYNASFLSVELIICVIILALLPVDQLYKNFTKASV
jgi:thiamine transporter